jgi:hypothetical protein
MAGNTATSSFTVTVQDTTPPTITVPANITAEATSGAGAAVTFTASASDLVDGPVSVTASPASGSLFPLGTTTVTVTATDAHGNTASKSFKVTVLDTAPPSITVPANITAEATSAAGAAVSYTASATDEVDGPLAVTCSPPPGSVFPMGQTIVTVTATDSRGHKASKSFTVTVRDTTAPGITVPANITAEATSVAGAAVTFTASASDLVDGAVAVTYSPAPGSVFPLGTTTVTCTATDAHGNRATATFTVCVTCSCSGLLPPINPNGSSIFKLGRTVPVKFRLTGASAGISNLVAHLSVTTLSDGLAGNDVDTDPDYVPDGGNTFRYDASGGQYIFNLSTKSLSQGTWVLQIDLGDGVKRTVQIGLRN